MRSDGPSAQECVGGPTAETDLGVTPPSEVVIDVREVQQGDYVRVTLRFENTKRNNAADIILRNVMYTHTCPQEQQKVSGISASCIWPQ